MNAIDMTQEQLDTLELKHEYGLDGFCYIRDLGDDMCQVAFYDVKNEYISNVFLAWKKLLTFTMVQAHKPTADIPVPPMIAKRLPPEQRNAVAVLRAQLASGEAVIFLQRVKLIKAA